MSSGRPALLTVGHGTADRPTIVELLSGAGVRLVVDVRRFPGSRRHPHVARDELAQWLPEAGIGYRWEPDLGGRRRLASVEDGPSPDTWWQVDAFRAYAAWTRTAPFGAAMRSLLAAVDEVAPAATTVMCSETVWWRCHRRLISDVAVLLHDRPVEHLGHDGRRSAHRVSPGARVTPDGLVYDGVVEDRPVEDGPVEDRPSLDRPVERSPVEDRPSPDRPVEDGPVERSPG